MAQQNSIHYLDFNKSKNWHRVFVFMVEKSGFFHLNGIKQISFWGYFFFVYFFQMTTFNVHICIVKTYKRIKLKMLPYFIQNVCIKRRLNEKSGPVSAFDSLCWITFNTFAILDNWNEYWGGWQNIYQNNIYALFSFVLWQIQKEQKKKTVCVYSWI